MRTTINRAIICREYDKTRNIKKVAERFNISKAQVIKTLSTEGYILNYKHNMIMEMYRNNKSVEIIAEKVHLSVRTVKVYLPAKNYY